MAFDEKVFFVIVEFQGKKRPAPVKFSFIRQEN